MTREQFLEKLQAHAATFAKAVATNEGEWIIKGFIDVYRRIYTISVDTKIVSKVLELILYPMFLEFEKSHGLKIDLCPQQNFYPDLTFTHEASGHKFAVDIKSTYRTSDTEVNGMTLAADERKQFTLDDLPKIPSVVKNFQFFAQPKFRIASSLPGSGNTKNIGSVIKIEELVNGTGPFASLGEEVYDDYWMFYLTRDMAQALSLERPYMNLKSYLDYKKRGADTLRAHAKEIASLAEDEAGKAEEESE